MTTNDSRVAVLETSQKYMADQIKEINHKVDNVGKDVTSILKLVQKNKEENMIALQELLSSVDTNYAKKADVAKLYAILRSVIGFVFASGMTFLFSYFTKG